VEPGTRVAIQLPNVPQAAVAYFAALSLGAEVVMTNPLYTKREVQHQWSDSACKVAITMDFLWDSVIKDNRGELHPESYVVCGIPDYLGFPLNFLAPLKLKKQDPPKWAKVAPAQGMVTWKQLMKTAGQRPAPAKIDLDQIAVLQYTGGTTGPSKGAMLSHRNLSCNVQQIDAWFTGVEYGREVLLTALPLFHVFGMSVCMNFAIWAGACMVLMPNPRDFSMLVKAISKHKVTLFPGVPALFNGLNNFPGIENIDVSSVKSCFSGSAPIPPDVLERFEQLTGARIIEGFGMSETSPVSHVNPLWGKRKVGYVGIPVSDTEAKVVDVNDDSIEMPQGEEGELLIKGPQVMQGYWGREEATAESLAGGWMHTGDLARIDEDGFFKIVGRKKDMINCSGLKVFPDEVDESVARRSRASWCCSPAAA
jgi:long-chain acyl-CoA synthetase